MNIQDIKVLLHHRENEHLEFKEAKNGFSILGKDDGTGKQNKKSVLGYCVALGNEGGGKLILGISEDLPRKIVGTSALENPGKVKSKIYSLLGIKINVYELFDENANRIVIIEMPSRKPGIPLKFYGVPLMRIDEELVPMDDITELNIRNEIAPDWSAQICKTATIHDLDLKAIIIARNNFKKKNPRLSTEVDTWSDEMFLDKAKISIKGALTNTAIILLGKEESNVLLSPAIIQITWILKGNDGTEKDYTHFTCPLILSVDNVYKKIRNLKYRYIKDATLFPEEVDMYDPYVIREALHNCIAHQDYSLKGRIQVIENEDGYLLFTNKGQFLPGSIERVIEADSPQEYYKNKFLVDAMVNLNMIDTIGSGIKKMFTVQKEKFFPLPSYDLSENKVAVTIYGKLLDVNYARTLANHKDLNLLEIMLLDQIQKGKKISKISAKKLKEKSLIEGRYPNVYISEQVAGETGEMATYIKNRGFHNEHYKKMVKEYLTKNPGASRQNIDELLTNILPAILTEKQKKNRITNLLYDLSHRDKSIVNKGNTRKPRWEINT